MADKGHTQRFGVEGKAARIGQQPGYDNSRGITLSFRRARQGCLESRMCRSDFSVWPSRRYRRPSW